MKRKYIIGIIILLVVVLCVAVFLYMPYQNQLHTSEFNKELQNTSSTEAEILKIRDDMGSQNSTDVDVFIKTVNDDISPKYSDELNKLNEAEKHIDNNQTRSDYVKFQKQRIELESQNYNLTVKIYNALAQYYKGEKSPQDANATINNASTELATVQNDLNAAYTNIRNLLKDNPEFNSTLQDLKLADPFYGNPHVLNNTNITNTTQ